MESEPFSDSPWSFNYFFYKRQLKKILYFKCLSNSIYSSEDDVTATNENPDDESEQEIDMDLDWEDGV